MQSGVCVCACRINPKRQCSRYTTHRIFCLPALRHYKICLVCSHSLCISQTPSKFERRILHRRRRWDFCARADSVLNIYDGTASDRLFRPCFPFTSGGILFARDTRTLSNILQNSNQLRLVWPHPKDQTHAAGSVEAKQIHCGLTRGRGGIVLMNGAD